MRDDRQTLIPEKGKLMRLAPALLLSLASEAYHAFDPGGIAPVAWRALDHIGRAETRPGG